MSRATAATALRLTGAVVTLLLALSVWQPVGAGETPPPWRTAPPAPYDGWDVTVTPDKDDWQVVELAFDSPLLQRRAINHVYLPTSYFESHRPFPVAYFLHGTIRIHTAQPAADAADQVAGATGQTLPYPLGAGNGRAPTKFVRASLDEADYLIVTPDSGPQSWCEFCFWIDGHKGAGVPAESHLHDELLPLVEAVFRTRTDRAGRALFGRSMGAGGALIHGFRHPDRFAFIGALSPYMDFVDEDPLLVDALWAAYTRGQGYPNPRHDQMPLRNYNPADLATSVVGTPIEIVVSIGDGCVANTEGSCEDNGLLVGFPAAAGQEIALRPNNDRWMPRLIQQGVPITYIQREGTHGPINQDSYERFMLPRMNKLFAEGTPDPQRFSYKTADRSFGIWGYDITVERPNAEFLSLLGARLDGRELTLAGTGTATLTTPPRFHAGRSYTVITTPAGEPPSERTVVADTGGRLTVEVPLGPARTNDERKELVTQGSFDFPQTRVEVLDR